MTYLLPFEWTDTMVVLQDACPESTLEEIVEMFEKDTGKDFNEYFSEFDTTPIGVASLAQVHIATIRENGQKVAVKFQHPSLSKFVPLDVLLTKAVFDLMYKVFPEYPLTWLGDELQDSIYVELNFANEAKNAEKTAEYFKPYHKLTTLRIPVVYEALPRLLIMEFVGGARLDNLKYLDDHNISRAEVSSSLSHIFNNMIFKSGFVHCDPHHGNLAIRALDGKDSDTGKNFEIVLYDHGLYRTIPNQMKIDYSKFWLAMLEKDSEAMKKYGTRFAQITDEQFPVLAAAITGRDFDHALTGNIVVSREDSEIENMRDLLVGNNVFLDLMSLLASVPRIVLLILKTNDLVRHLDESLKNPLGQERTFLILVTYCAETAYKDEKASISKQFSKWSMSWCSGEVRAWWNSATNAPPGGNFSNINNFQGDRGNRPNSRGGRPPQRNNNRSNTHSSNNNGNNSFSKGNQNVNNNNSRLNSGQQGNSHRGRGGRFQGSRRGNFQGYKSDRPDSRNSHQNNKKNTTDIINNAPNMNNNPIANTPNKAPPHENGLARFESQYVGAFVQNPEAIGFQKLQRKPQSTPKYLMKENVLFDSSSFQQNEWDRKNQQMLEARETEYSGDPQILFEEFQEYRKEERKLMEKLNLVDAENAKKSLNDAIVFRGSCYDMCPVYERVERVFKNQVSSFEKEPATGKISKYYALKTFIRPSGQAPSLPSDVRAPIVLVRTLNYIIDNLLQKLPESHNFIWDRTRSIRQDFTFQNNYSGIESIECHEKICRIHILCLHVMTGANDPDYQQQQEVEQFNNSLQTLTHMYDDVRSRGGRCPNEAEFRAYELISKWHDPELDRNVQQLPKDILNDNVLQRALMLRGLVLQGVGAFNVYTEFFKAVMSPSTPFLLSCLTEIHFNEIRYNFFKAIFRAFHSKGKKLGASTVAQWMGFDSIDQFLETCKLYEIPVLFEDGEQKIEFMQMKSAFKQSQKQPYSQRLDTKVTNKTFKDVINSGFENTGLGLNNTKNLEKIAKDSFAEHKTSSEFIKKVLNDDNPSIASAFTQTQKTSSSAFTSTSFQPAVNTPFQKAFNNASQPAAINAFQQTANTPFQSVPNNAVSPFTAKTPDVAFGSISKPAVATFSTAPFGGFSKESQKPSKSFTVNNVQKPGSVSQGDKSVTISQTAPSLEDLPPTPSPVPPPAPPAPKKRMKECANYHAALRIVFKDMFVKVVQETASKAVSKAVQQIEISQRRAKESQRQHLISSLTQELCESFLREQIYLNVLEAKAKVYRNQTLKKFSISRIKLSASESLKKQINIRAKETELLNFTNTVVPMFAAPHKSSSSLYPTIPLITQGAPSFDVFDFSKLLSGLNKSMLNINGTVIVSDADSVQSEWLFGKLGLAKVPGKHIEGSYNEDDFHLQLSGFPSYADVFNHNLLEYSLFVVQISLEGSDNAAAALQTLDANAKFLSGLVDYIERNANVPSVSLVVLFCGSAVLPLSDARVSSILSIHGKKSSNSKISTSLLILPPFVTSMGSIDWKLIDHKLFNILRTAFHQIVSANIQIRIH
ncbi:unnamed protein product [Ambrosiozyma monospora]|uniref:Unnamed protein product n=1 Tax=Ambrosiozyma monospora TaxID=43982 RepID=A0A9W6YVC3_AMBMO|nr:unnamed protein product [Ambrosiozyma monospora]